jgi:hypothetical protein
MILLVCFGKKCLQLKIFFEKNGYFLVVCLQPKKWFEKQFFGGWLVCKIVKLISLIFSYNLGSWKRETTKRSCMREEDSVQE